MDDEMSNPKKLKVMFRFILLLLCFVIGCNTDDLETSYETVEATVESGETFEHDLGSFGDEEGAFIHEEPEHAKLSDLERVDYTQVIYRYEAEDGFTGEDYVELRSERGSDGASENTDIRITKIEITVEE